MVSTFVEPIDMPSSQKFVDEFVATNTPAIVRGMDYSAGSWTPEALKTSIGDLTALVYGTLFDLEDIQTLEDYIDTWFGLEGELEPDVPYVRWYNQLKDVEFSWGDAAFARVAGFWKAPACLPTSNFVVPVSRAEAGTDPVRDAFPYRGLLVAARGARTRMHRDPFCSDAVVCQFYGRKEVALYRPERADELTKQSDGTSFGGFVDVRSEALDRVSVEPDLHGTVGPGEMVYIPHGWLHDVIAVEDSVSITWNFVHAKGAGKFAEYLNGAYNGDPEFEVLQYFHRSLGRPQLTAKDIASYHFGVL
ncbi:MAG: cupin-like domain-containing protein [Alphaproteobacteria bacterium]|nr:cupin-like domain-containing protein [Alphaproteobacteria bacterium]